MKSSKKFVAATIGIFALTGLSLLTVFVLGGERLSTLERNLSSHLYETREASQEVLLVAIDDHSITDEVDGGLGRFGTWDRTIFAGALDQIEKGNPTAVFFDILFASGSQSISKSTLFDLVDLYPTVGEFSNAVAQYMGDIHPSDQVFADSLGAYDNDFLVKLIYEEVGWNEDKSALLYKGATEPLGLFEALTETGFPNIPVEEESTNASMIFGIPRYYQEVGAVSKEENIDFKLAEKLLGYSPENVPLVDGQMLINYSAQSYEWPTVSFSDVYNGKVDPSIFKNKLVLIGTTASILQDRHFTPIDSASPMPGVEIHANAIQTILDGTYLQEQSGMDYLIQTLLSLIVIICVTLFMPLWMSAIVAILSLALFPFYAQMRFDNGTVVQILTPIFTLIAAYLSVLVYRNFTEFAEKRKLKEAFGRYVSPELVAQISEHPEQLKLGGERRAITALFLDIENFTNLSESLEPQAVVSVINTYFDALSKVIMQKGGTVDKFEGDAIMALFGAPVPSEDHGLRACETALAIREKMEELNKTTGYKLNIRIGLATGDAIVGNMGSENRFDYTAMGDTVNTASRLEGANKFYSTRILVTEGTYEAAKGSIFMRQVDLVCLKGKDKAIRIYEVLGPLSGASEEGQKVVADWHSALDAYRCGRFDEAEKGFRAVLATLPDDGPSKTMLGRVATLKLTALKDWDGVWKFESK